MRESQKATAGAAPSKPADRSRQAPTPAASTRPGNPARRSKFAGLNLRQRASEQAEAIESEPEEQGHGHPEAAAPNDRNAGEAPSVAPQLDVTANHASVDSGAAGPVPTTESYPAPPPVSTQASESSPDREEQIPDTAAQRQHSVSSKSHDSRDRSGGSQEPRHRAQQGENADAGEWDRAPTRRRGKRTDPDYVQVTAYVRQETYRRARIKLLESSKPQEFSEVVEELLTRWLRTSS